MTTDEYASQIVEQLKTAENYTEVEAIIEKNDFIIQRCLAKLQSILENLSPLAFNSTEWSSFRYAIIHLRRQSLLQAVTNL
ncbi:hypothetical protein SAMN05518672_11146 [Chitinophaga sp. CF118]|uniref:hypothetical protein n=1 Tax=Chitinophaga sp. CF118 TaxID=1884367 RepID=UPI0008EC2D08|nr:hypothetical protein [Chitinophaga sp. CF118]SFE85324.1 hypothetical protein SAMN05518672_11146 [Chitinophaga sp. CF118]